MASIRKKGPYQWHVQIRKKGWPKATRTFETEQEAIDWATVTEAEMVRGVYIDRTEAEKKTLKDALDDYLEDFTEKKDGAVQEKTRIKMWQASPFADRSLASLRPKDFKQWSTTRLKTVAPSTVQKDLAVISHLFTVARKEWGLPVDNPISAIRMPREDNSRERRLEPNEEKRLIEELKPIKGRSPWMIPLVKVAIGTAARQSELLALKWEDVDLKNSVIRIYGKEREDGKRRTKNKTKYRDVPLWPETQEALEKMPRSIGGKVFPISAGGARTAFTDAVNRAREKYVEECKAAKKKPDGFMTDLVFHDLRHEGTTRLAEIYEIHELMKITGHNSTRMLARYYHPRGADLARKMREKLAAMI